MTRKAFEFKKSYEEVELSGDTYKIEFTDEKLLQYQKNFDKFHKKSKELNAIDTSKATTEEQEKIFKDTRQLVKWLVEELLGKDTFEKLYSDSGNSLMNMIDLVVYLSDVVGDKTKDIQDKRKKKYLVKKK